MYRFDMRAALAPPSLNTTEVVSDYLGTLQEMPIDPKVPNAYLLPAAVVDSTRDATTRRLRVVLLGTTATEARVTLCVPDEQGYCASRLLLNDRVEHGWGIQPHPCSLYLLVDRSTLLCLRTALLHAGAPAW